MEEPTKRLTIRLPESLHTKFKARAAELKITMHDYVIKKIQEFAYQNY